MGDDLKALDATAQAELVRTGKASPAELVDAAIARIERDNPKLNAVNIPLLQRARDAARGDLPDGPFRGVPFLIKDLELHWKGVPLHCGMQVLKDLDYRSTFDSFLLTKFLDAGFVICGRTNTPELGILPTTEPHSYGPTRNPWNPDYHTGGSSGGSAAAVAAGMAPVAHATDGGGSIRIPASVCGLFGLKPTRGRVSMGPDLGEINGGLVCPHVVSRSVRDSAAILDWIQGPMPGDPYYAPPPARPYVDELAADPEPMTIGFTWQRMEPDGTMGVAHDDCIAMMKDVVALLEQLGHRLVELKLPESLTDGEYVNKFIAIWAAGQAHSVYEWEKVLDRELGERDLEPLTWALTAMGRITEAHKYMSGWQWLRHNSRRLALWWQEQKLDLVLTPCLAEPPLPLGQFIQPPGAGILALMRAAAYAAFTPPYNVTGQPAMSVPLHRNAAGLPIGAHFVAPYAREDLLFALAGQLERARPFQFPG